MERELYLSAEYMLIHTDAYGMIQNDSSKLPDVAKGPNRIA